MKYGYSAEELFSSEIYSTRKELFYRFYRDVILSPLSIPPGSGYTCLKELEEMGIVNCIITRRIFGLPGRAGCKNVIDLHGNVYHNFCPHCGRTYSMEYVRDHGKIPLCETCNTPVRPKVSLFGEMVDNAVITRAANEMEKADVVLVLGTNLKTYLCTQLMGYFEGSNVVVINSEPHFSDRYADIVIHERVDECLEEMIQYLREQKEFKKDKEGNDNE